MFQSISRTLSVLLLTIGFVLSGMPIQAKVTVEEAQRLKGDLTPYGAERAGNAEGTIPAWEGGLATTPEGITFDPLTEEPPDPFADDKIRFTITSENVGQYKDKLSACTLKVFERYPDTWKMHIYPTRRTFAAPQWVYDNVYKNALEAELIEDGSKGFIGAHGGIPFPVPQNGREILFNHLQRYEGKGLEQEVAVYIVYPNGSHLMTDRFSANYSYPYYTTTRDEYDPKGNSWSVLAHTTAPARSKGTVMLLKDRTDITDAGRAAWQYLPGQRRVRRAPNVGYDTPHRSSAGLFTYDDSYGFNGPTDRWDLKLIGKKEILVPYNNYKLDLAPVDELLTPLHVNPEFIRWELHRVWIVEATVKEGQRHVYGRQIFYHDEDSYILLMKDMYDNQGKLWRGRYGFSKQHYHFPAMIPVTGTGIDFQTDDYAVANVPNGLQPAVEKPMPTDKFTPQNVRKMGRR